MKNTNTIGKILLLILPLVLSGVSGQSQSMGWVLDATQFQYQMTLVGQIRLDGIPNDLQNNALAAFYQGQLRGYATPVRVNNKAYYFMALFSNTYKDEPLELRAYIGAERRVYRAAAPVVFRHHLALGEASAPEQLDFTLSDTPLIYTPSTVQYAENTCNDVFDIQASDKQDAEGNGLTYHISGGADASKFSVNAQTGVLSWSNFAPDYESPADANADNRYEVEVTVTDASNKKDVQAITVVVVKSLPVPALVCPSNMAISTNDDGAGNCSASTFNTAVALASLCDAYQLSYQLSGATAGSGTGLVPATQLFNKGVTNVTYSRAPDSHCMFTVFVADNEAPALNCPPNLTIEASKASNYYPPLIQSWIATASTTDNCGSTFSANYTGGIPLLSCNLTFGLTVVFTATDAAANTSKCTRKVYANDTKPPVFTSVPANVTVACNAIPPVGTATATDLADIAPTIAYAGQTRIDGTCPDAYTLVRKWTATDDCNNVQTATQQITVQDTQIPAFNSVPANVTVQCSGLPSLGAPLAYDNCDASVSLTFTGQTQKAGTCPDSYTLTRYWTATDNCGNTRTASQRVTVVDTQKPVFTAVPTPATIQCSDPVPPVGSPLSTDNCDASVSINYLGQTTTNATCSNAYKIVRTWKATDNCGNIATTSQIITVQDTQKPAFTSVPAHITIECSDLFPVTPGPATASDNCGGAVQVVFNGQTSASGFCPQNYAVTRQWTATDGCGNTRTATQKITVLDTQAPVFVNPPANLTLSCTAPLPTVPVVTASDACDTNVPTNYLGETKSGPNCPYTVTRRWTTSDDCGNALTYTQVITVTQNLEDSGDARSVDLSGAGRPAGRVSVAPNPAADEVRIGLDAEIAGEALLGLLDATGRLVLQQRCAVSAGANYCWLSLTGVPDGLYALQVQQGGQQMTARLLVGGR